VCEKGKINGGETGRRVDEVPTSRAVLRERIHFHSGIASATVSGRGTAPVRSHVGAMPVLSTDALSEKTNTAPRPSSHLDRPPRRTAVIGLGGKVLISKWSGDRQQVTGAHPDMGQINTFLSELESTDFSAVSRFRRAGTLIVGYYTSDCVVYRILSRIEVNRVYSLANSHQV
jgi:hypothetical protein